MPTVHKINLGGDFVFPAIPSNHYLPHLLVKIMLSMPKAGLWLLVSSLLLPVIPTLPVIMASAKEIPRMKAIPYKNGGGLLSPTFGQSILPPADVVLSSDAKNAECEDPVYGECCAYILRIPSSFLQVTYCNSRTAVLLYMLLYHFCGCQYFRVHPPRDLSLNDTRSSHHIHSVTPVDPCAKYPYCCLPGDACVSIYLRLPLLLEQRNR